MSFRVHIIDDEQSLLKLLQLSLQTPKGPFEFIASDTGAIALEKTQKDIFDAIVCDIGLPDANGLDLLQKFKQIHPHTPVVMITAHGSVETALKAMKLGAYDYIQKPFEPEELRLVIERGIREQKLQADYSRLKQEVSTHYDFSNIIGSSAAMKQVFQRIKKAADTKSTILILGESGTGKELLAKALHYNSPRKDAPLVIVDCASIPANLLESELFGHVKGAFTGADKAKKGLCEEADGGTLFLDEIGEMPLELQSKLLRLLQESTLRRVGDTKPISIDVRVVAATHRNLEEDVKTGKFRQDLFYRLNVVPLHAPALRERREDIPLLAAHFLKKYARDYDRPIRTIHPEVLHQLTVFDWPGNVRQLENLIEQMVVMSEGETLTMNSLPPPLNARIQLEPPTVREGEWDLKKVLERIQAYTEESLIRKALGNTKGNKTRAASLLGISRRALIYKAQEYKIDDQINMDPDSSDEENQAHDSD